MYYLVKDTMGAKLVVIGQYKKKEGAVKRKELEEYNKYSFETYWVCSLEEYKELLLSYI